MSIEKKSPVSRREFVGRVGGGVIALGAIAGSRPLWAEDKLFLQGYTDRSSYLPGERIAFHLSSNAQKFQLEFARIGAEREVVETVRGIDGREHPIPEDSSSHGCRWPVGFEFEIPSDWRTGYYEITPYLDEQDENGARREGKVIPLVVRSSAPGETNRILLQLSTNTSNAYNNWGGYSLYAYNGRDNVQGRRVSYERPQDVFARMWEVDFIRWAEKNGYGLDYAVNNDLEFHPDILPHYRLVLSVGHDEYWSSPMRDHLEAFIAKGGNVAFFSGNTCCWQVRNEEGGKAMTCWKQAFTEDPLYNPDGPNPLLSTLWSHYLVDRPENSLTGVGFLWGGFHRSHGQFMDGSGAFTVHRPDHWVLEGTGLKEGDEFGGTETIVGYECDGCEVEWRDGRPYPTHRNGTPEGFEILATAPARWHPDDCEWYERWEKGRTGAATPGVYTIPGGGTVFTSATTDWPHGLRGTDPIVERITRNVLDRLTAG